MFSNHLGINANGLSLATGCLGRASSNIITTLRRWVSIPSGSAMRKTRNIRTYHPTPAIQISTRGVMNFHKSTSRCDMCRSWSCLLTFLRLYFHGTGSVTFPEEGRHCANDNPNIITCYYSGGWQESYPVPQVTVSLTNVEPPRSQ